MEPFKDPFFFRSRGLSVGDTLNLRPSWFSTVVCFTRKEGMGISPSAGVPIMASLGSQRGWLSGFGGKHTHACMTESFVSHDHV